MVKSLNLKVIYYNKKIIKKTLSLKYINNYVNVFIITIVKYYKKTVLAIFEYLLEIIINYLNHYYLYVYITI